MYLAAICSILVVFGFILSPQYSDIEVAIINRSVGVVLFCFVGVFIERHKHLANDVRTHMQERLRQFLDTAATGLTRCSRDLRYLAANAAYAKLVGLSVDKIVGRPIVEVMGAEALETIRPYFERALRGERVEYETEVPFAASGPRWLHVVYTPDRDEQDNLIGWVASVIDITALKQAEKRMAIDLEAITRLHRLSTLFACEARLEPVLTEIVDTAIAIAGADFGTIQLLDAESGDLRIAGQRGFPPWWLDFWDSVQKGKGSCGTALACGERVIVEDVEQSPIFLGTPALDIQRKVGVRAIQSTPLVSRAGKLLGIFSTHYKTPYRPDERACRLLDLLAQQAADMIDRMENDLALRKSEERFRALVKASSDVVYRMGDDWTEMRQLVGKDFIADTAASSRTWLQKYIPPDDQAQVMAVIQEAIRTKSIFELEHRVIRVDGSLGWTHSRAIPILDPKGRILEWFGMASDVTARKEAEEALRKSEVRYHTLVDAASAITWSCAPSGLLVQPQPSWMAFTGQTAEEMLGAGWTNSSAS